MEAVLEKMIARAPGIGSDDCNGRAAVLAVIDILATRRRTILKGRWGIDPDQRHRRWRTYDIFTQMSSVQHLRNKLPPVRYLPYNCAPIACSASIGLRAKNLFCARLLIIWHSRNMIDPVTAA